MTTQTILVIEDDRPIREGVVDALTFSGYGVLQAPDGAKGIELAISATYDLLLLDLVLPHYSGFDILEKLRDLRSGMPVIILSARGEEADRVRGLKLGADDYVVKPFSVNELLPEWRQSSDARQHDQKQWLRLLYRAEWLIWKPQRYATTMGSARSYRPGKLTC